jgi:hypothetical protein
MLGADGTCFGIECPPELRRVEDCGLDWSELKDKVEFIDELFARNGVRVKAEGGLAAALEEARALAAGEKIPGAPSGDRLRAIAHDAHVIWALAEGLRACDGANLELKAHLAQLTTGTTDYGTVGSGHDVYFKDFECEVFIAATLVGHGTPVAFSTEPNDPRGDLIAAPLRVEVKHPNSSGQLQKLLRKFNGKLRADDLYGVFVVGIEDMFSLGEQDGFASPVDFHSWLEEKRGAMEAFGVGFLRDAAHFPRILAVAQTQTMVEVIAGASTLRRLGNACVFDDRPDVPEDAWERAVEVARSFNPQPRRWTELGLG